MTATPMDATLIGASLRLRPYYEQIPVRDISLSYAQRHKFDKQFCNDVLLPSINSIGCVEAIGVRIVHGKSKYELIYGIQRWFSCETKLAEAERALQFSDTGTRSLQRIEYERWVEIPCKVYASETSEAQVKLLQEASNISRQGTTFRVDPKRSSKPSHMSKAHLVICQTLRQHDKVTQTMICEAMNKGLDLNPEAEAKKSSGSWRHPFQARVSELCTRTKFGEAIVERYELATRSKLYRLTDFGNEYYDRYLTE